MMPLQIVRLCKRALMPVGKSSESGVESQSILDEVHNRRPILVFARGSAHICGVTCTELVLDVALLRLRLIRLASLHMHAPPHARSSERTDDYGRSECRFDRNSVAGSWVATSSGILCWCDQDGLAVALHAKTASAAEDRCLLCPRHQSGSLVAAIWSDGTGLSPGWRFRPAWHPSWPHRGAIDPW